MSASSSLAQDCNGNGIPDACDISCGTPGGPCDVPGCGTRSDCNSNGIPDDCEVPGTQSSLDFDGNDDRVTIPRSASLEPINELTIEAWIRLDTNGGANSRIARKSADFGGGFILAASQASDHHLQLRIDDATLGSAVAADPAFLSVYFGQWHHVAGVYSAPGNFCRLYVDGVQKASVAAAGQLNYSDADFLIGNFGEAEEGFDGLIDEVRLWNVARTEQQIRDDRTLKLIGNEAGLVGYWRFDEGSGQSVNDSSPFGNHGVLGSGVSSESQDPAWSNSGAPVLREPDCNHNGLPDSCDLSSGFSSDCNGNGIPDDCESGWTLDCNHNGVPDICDLTNDDCNQNGIPDECETGGTTDCNGNGIPDLCDIAAGTSADCNANGVPDSCDIASGTSQDSNNTGVPDECEYRLPCERVTPCGNFFLAPDDVTESVRMYSRDGTQLLASSASVTDVGGTLSTDWNNNLMVPEWTSRISVISPLGTLVSTITGESLSGVTAAAVTPDGLIAVCCYLSDTINFYNPSGTYLSYLGGNTDDPESLAYDRSGNLYVGCRNGGHPYVSKFDRQMQFVQLIGAGQFTEHCFGVAFDMSENLWVTTSGAIRKFSHDGTLLATITRPGLSPAGIAIDETGVVWVANSAALNVFRFSSAGQYLSTVAVSFGANPPAGLKLFGIVFDTRPPQDCNFNGISDSCDIAAGLSDCDHNGILDLCENPDAPDCNHNGIPDSCEIASGAEHDCNGNGIPDSCDIANGTSVDCNADGIPDECQFDHDCNHNGINDLCETGGSADCDGDGITDWCEIDAGAPDCDHNLIPDNCEPDCNQNGIADACEVPPLGNLPDCNGNLIPDECELFKAFSVASPQLSPFDRDHQQSFVASGLPDAAGPVNLTFSAVADFGPQDYVDLGLNDQPYFAAVLDGFFASCGPAVDSLTISPAQWNSILLSGRSEVHLSMRPSVGIEPVCNESHVQVTISYMTQNDCNGNGIPDECDISSGHSNDCDSNGIPDECSTDCNHNGISDACDIFSGTSADCNFNRIPDECEVPPLGNGPDCNSNGIPDDCESDCNGNGIPDDCDLKAPLALFSPINAYGVGDQPYAIIAADLNGDTRPDLITANYQANTLSILRNAGGGGFLPSIDVGVRTRPEALVASDLDGDGDLDIAVVNFQSRIVSILRNNGDGTFAPRIDIFLPLSAGLSSISAADYDSDGDIDLAVACADTNHVAMIMNGGLVSGVWQGMSVGSTFPVATSPVGVRNIDVNGDGLPDLVTANRGANSVSVLINRGHVGGGSWLGFAAAVNTTVGSAPSAVAVGDFDQDGKPDVAASNSGSNTVSILLNQGIDGTGAWLGFSASAPIAVGALPHSVTAADLNGDGRTDLAVSNPDFPTNDGRMISVVLNLGRNQSNTWQGFAPAINYPTCAMPYDVVAVDIDGDGDLDLAAAGNALDEVWVMPNNGAAEFPLDTIFHTGRDPYSVAISDVDRNNHEDVLVVNRQDDTLVVLPNSGNAVFSGATSFAVGDAPQSLAVADFDRDGWPDAAVANYGTNNVSILRNLHQGGTGQWLGFAGAVNYSTGFHPDYVGAADFDSLNGPDLAVINGDESTVSILLNNGSGAFIAPVNYSVGGAPQALAIGDFDGDGDQDFVVCHSAANALYLFLNNGNGTFSSPTTITAASSRFIIAADLDNDGDMDLVTAGVQVFLNRGRNSSGQWLGFATPVDYPAANSSIWVHAADLNGDGLPDLIATNQQEHVISILLNIGTGTFQLGGRWSAGNTPRAVATGHLSNDSRLDIAVTSIGSDLVAMILNASPGAASPDCNVNLLPDECDAPGDMNGDGYTDQADLPGFISSLVDGPCGIISDLDGDGQTNGRDIQLFVQSLLSPSLARPQTAARSQVHAQIK
ncbi:MAG TPA: FG-GAP-like repeat-containing protein [Phycisphaerae bacterium]|nr:FG-GAP-like repeat-containing protein [Phycisphaerae bacterium]